MKDKRPTKRFAAPARAGRPLRPQQLLILAYAAAVIVWLVYVLVGSAVMLNHKADGTMAVSYTHLDVYKRQVYHFARHAGGNQFVLRQNTHIGCAELGQKLFAGIMGCLLYTSWAA